MNPLAPTIRNPLAEVAKPLHEAANKALVDQVRRALDSEDPEEIDRGADELTLMGYDKTAGHLRERAQLLRAGRRRHHTALYPSPVPEASDEQWARFVRLMQTGDIAAVSPSGQVGLFQTRLKRLEDLGLARDVKRIKSDGGPRWTATFRPPLTLQRLLADPLLQYRIFVVSMKRYRNAVLGEHRGVIGTEIDGKRATLSGLLAVAHHAGPALSSWLASAEDRKRFARTTNAYHSTSEVF